MSSDNDLDMNDPKVQQIMKKCMEMLMNNQGGMNNMNNGNMNNMYNMNNMNNMNNMGFMNNGINMGMQYNNMNFMGGMNQFQMNNMNNPMNMYQMFNNYNANNMNNNMPNSMNNMNNQMANNMANNPPTIPTTSNSTSNMQINQNTQNNTNPQNNDEHKGLLPRGNQVVGDKILQPVGDIINVNIDASTGTKTIINISQESPVIDLLKKYCERNNLGESHIGKSLAFLFNGRKINEDDYNKTIKKLGIVNMSTVTVYDQGNVIGA